MSLLTTASKRTVDIILGTVLSVIALPVVLILAVAVAFTLRASPFFVQTRPGRGGRDFRIVKLRTLPTSTPRYMDKHTLGLATAKLPRLCALMRRTHLDELPQLGSVVIGTMSLVGPRPALPAHVEPVGDAFDAARRSVRPGCTGLWQLSTASSDTATSAPRFDLFYLYNASLRLDLWILVRTIGWVVGLAKPIELEDIPKWTLGSGLLSDPRQRIVAVGSERHIAEHYLGPPPYSRRDQAAEPAAEAVDAESFRAAMLEVADSGMTA